MGSTPTTTYLNYNFLLDSTSLNSNTTYNYSYWYKLTYSQKGSFFFYTVLPNFKHQSSLPPVNTDLSSNFNIFFFRKEVFYTKLKYSRVPQFDTSAGAAASFMSGMYGFMVSEKYGFELIDSGDFLFLVIFIAFIVLLGSTLTTIINARTSLLLDLVSAIRSFF